MCRRSPSIQQLKLSNPKASSYSVVSSDFKKNCLLKLSGGEYEVQFQIGITSFYCDNASRTIAGTMGDI